MNRHESQRGYFSYKLYQNMAKNKDIWLVTADLGYKVFDQHFKNFPDRCINTGAAEQAACGVAVGLALEGKLPFFYSITPFLLGRAFEWVRNYIDHEKIPVVLVGSGRNDDYAHDGFTHYAGDDDEIMGIFKNIYEYKPRTKEEVPAMVEEIIKARQPSYINLSR